jgi:flagellin
MAMVINTNIGSENAVRLLDKSARSQATTMERLTSGQSINHSKDNAAGQTVVIGMDSQVRGTNQAVRNANDAMALIQTADGASDEVIGMLQRQRELSLQALNGTYNQENRSQMNTEFKQISTEINRVAATTKFNELPIMAQMTSKGSFLASAASTRIMQVGWEVGNGGSGRDKIQVSMGNFWTGASKGSGIFGKYMHTGGNGSRNSVANATSGAYSKASIGTVAAASVTVMRIDSALSNIGTLRAKWGALQNRLEHTTSNLNNVNENIMAARSRIQDTDYAKESANLARTQVLQQAGMSMLGQANQSGQSVMSLLR